MLSMISAMPPAQRLAMTIAILGLLGGSTTQLTDMLAPFGSAAPVIVKEIVSISSFLTGILGVVMTFMTGQSSQILAVQKMAGVEKIVVNAKANTTLATLAIDPAQDKIEAAPDAQKAVTETAAKG